ncbi:MAG: hypothetical protein KDD47_06540, partial [Acidobacteria bacterium]|nr:hypothetical protein [Acidobacteriota bacterium]
MAVTLTTAPAGQANGAVKAPAWARELLGPSPAAVRRQVGGIEVSVLQGKDRAMVSAVVGGALRLARKAFEDATTATYEAVRQELETLTACHPLRLWNFIPELLAPLGDLPHRYMAFNAGRYRS